MKTIRPPDSMNFLVVSSDKLVGERKIRGGGGGDVSRRSDGRRSYLAPGARYLPTWTHPRWVSWVCERGGGNESVFISFLLPNLSDCSSRPTR